MTRVTAESRLRAVQRLSVRFTCIGVFLVAGLAAPVSAQRPDLTEADRLLARNHFERGNLLYDGGNYTEAAAEFEAAYALTHHVDLLYNVYTAQERAGELVEARAALERYLAEATIEQDRREALQVRLARLRERIARAQAAEEAAERERAEAAARLQAEREEREAAEREMAAEREAQASRAAEERRRARQATADMLTLMGTIGLITGGVGLANFVVFAGLSEAEDQALAPECGRDLGGICHRYQVENLVAFNTTADASLVIGASLAAAGTIALVVAETERPPARGHSETPRALLVPYASPSGAGAVVGGVF